MSSHRIHSVPRLALVLLLAAACAPAPQQPGLVVQKPRVELPTPMPEAFEVEMPRRDLPAAVAELAGIWRGEWLAPDQAAGTPGTPHTLVVKRVDGAGPAFTAPVIWSVGGPQAGSVDLGEGFVELSATVAANGALSVAVPSHGTVVYRLAPGGQRLTAEGVLAGRPLRATLGRYPEWGVPPGSAAPGPLPAAGLAGRLLAVGIATDQIR